MAKRRYSKKGNKIQPSEMTLSFVVELTEANTESTIDLSQVASLVNRRFYRQGINWAVAGFKMITPGSTTAEITIGKLPNTWVMSNAWEKGFRAWQRQQNEVLEDGTQESVKAKFNDFKIFADLTHLTSGISNNLLPIGFSPGEWEASQIVIPNFGGPSVNYEPFIIGVGPDVPGGAGAFSLISAYQNSRGVPQSPDPSVPASVTSTDNIYSAMFDVGNDNSLVIDNVVGKNDELPYPQDDYPGGPVQAPNLQIHDIEYVTSTTIGGTTRLKGGNFPCGLIRVQNFNVTPAPTPEAPAFFLLQVDLIPGEHRGYLCEPMTDM